MHLNWCGFLHRFSPSICYFLSVRCCIRVVYGALENRASKYIQVPLKATFCTYSYSYDCNLPAAVWHGWSVCAILLFHNRFFVRFIFSSSMVLVLPCFVLTSSPLRSVSVASHFVHQPSFSFSSVRAHNSHSPHSSHDCNCLAICMHSCNGINCNCEFCMFRRTVRGVAMSQNGRMRSQRESSAVFLVKNELCAWLASYTILAPERALHKKSARLVQKSDAKWRNPLNFYLKCR